MPEIDSTKSDGDEVSIPGLLYLTIVYLVWGSTYLAIRIGVKESGGFQPFSLGAMRLTVAGTLLIAGAYLFGKRIKPSKSELAILGTSGILLWTVANGLVMWAEQHAPSGYAALMMGALPIWTVIIEGLLNRKFPSLFLITFLIIGFAGLGVLTVPQLLNQSLTDWRSILFLIVAPISWASGSVFQVRKPVKLSMVVSAGYQQLIGGVGFLFLILILNEPLPQPSLSGWGAWAYLTVVGSMIGFTSFVQAIKLLPSSLAMTYPFVNPVVAVFLGWLILSEQITLSIIMGMILIIIGVGGVFRERYRKQNSKEKSPH